MRSHTKFENNRVSRFDVYWTQTDRQAKIIYIDIFMMLLKNRLHIPQFYGSHCMIFVGRPSDVRILSGEGSVSSSQFNLSWTVSGFAPVTDSHIEARKAVGSESTLGGGEVTTEKLGRGQGRCFYKSIFKNELKKF